MNAHKVSVVVPFFNSEATLCRALESIASSSHENIEAILVDDCSTDRSAVIAADFSRKDRRFTHVRNPENRKVSFCRNRGMDESTGEYILFVDSDDRISKDWIRNLLGDAVTTNAEIVVGRTKRLHGAQEWNYEMKGLLRRGDLSFETVVFKDNSVVWNKLYAASLLKRENIRFEESICIGEDLLFNFQALGRAARIYYNDLGFYYYHADNESSIMRGSTTAIRISNATRLLRLLVECSATMERKNRSALRKVAKDILVEHYRQTTDPMDSSTLDLIRGVDPMLPHLVRFSQFRKSVRDACLRRLNRK